MDAAALSTVAFVDYSQVHRVFFEHSLAARTYIATKERYDAEIEAGQQQLREVITQELGATRAGDTERAEHLRIERHRRDEFLRQLTEHRRKRIRQLEEQLSRDRYQQQLDRVVETVALNGRYKIVFNSSKALPDHVIWASRHVDLTDHVINQLKHVLQ